MTATITLRNELEDAHTGVGGRRSQQSFLEWLTEEKDDMTSPMQKAAKEFYESIPEVWIVKIDETKYWNKDFLKKFKLKRIFGVYAFNRKKHVHCCEITPSYELNYLEKQYESGYKSESKREEIEDELRVASVDEDGVKYYHVSQVGQWLNDPQCLIHARCGALPKGNIGVYQVTGIDSLDDEEFVKDEMYELSSNGL